MYRNGMLSEPTMRGSMSGDLAWKSALPFTMTDASWHPTCTRGTPRREVEARAHSGLLACALALASLLLAAGAAAQPTSTNEFEGSARGRIESRRFREIGVLSETSAANGR